jgi:hypothetical protein
MFSIWIKRTASVACVALAVIGFAVAGCESEPARTADGPPPAGYDTWEEFYEARDKAYRDTDTQLDQRRQQRDTAAPKP